MKSQTVMNFVKALESKLEEVKNTNTQVSIVQDNGETYVYVDSKDDQLTIPVNELHKFQHVVA